MRKRTARRHHCPDPVVNVRGMSVHHATPLGGSGGATSTRRIRRSKGLRPARNAVARSSPPDHFVGSARDVGGFTRGIPQLLVYSFVFRCNTFEIRDATARTMSREPEMIISPESEDFGDCRGRDAAQKAWLADFVHRRKYRSCQDCGILRKSCHSEIIPRIIGLVEIPVKPGVDWKKALHFDVKQSTNIEVSESRSGTPGRLSKPSPPCTNRNSTNDSMGPRPSGRGLALRRLESASRSEMMRQ